MHLSPLFFTMMNTAAVARFAEDLTIRSATAADAEALSAFAARVFHDTFAPDNHATDIQAYLSDAFTPEKQAAEFADPTCVCLIAEMGSAMAGYALVRSDAPDPSAPDTRSIELQRFYVDRAWHGRGVAVRLMEASLRMAREREAATIWLGVWERNTRAIRFYAKHGFTDVGSQSFLLGTDLQTDRVMSRPVIEPS